MSSHNIGRSKRVMNLLQKVELLDKLSKGKSIASVARDYNVNESTVRYIKKNEDKIRQSVAESANCSTKVCSISRDVNIEKMEKLLNMWIEDMTQKKIPISSLIIRQKARNLHQHLAQVSNTDAVNFLASKGWFENFKKRFSLHSLKLVGESASADHESAQRFPAELKKIIDENGYLPQQVFNADETGLFWKKMPTRTFLSKNEKTAPGFKAAKDRITILFCANASGHMMKPMFVNKSMNPRALKGKDKDRLPVYWRANKKAWVTSTLFLDWFKNCFLLEAERYLSSISLPFKCLLLIDNAPGHPATLTSQNPNVQVVFLPPNTTSLIQPLDQGIIATFKAYYVRHTFSVLLKEIDEGSSSSVSQSWKNYNIADCLINVRQAVNEIKPSTIKACWKNVWPEIVTVNDPPTLDEVILDTVKIARQVEGEGFADMQSTDVQELIESREEELSFEELEALLAPNSPNHESDDEDVEIVRPELTINSLNEIFALANQLKEKVFESDPIKERSLKFNRELDHLVAPYQEVKKELEQSKKQLKITNFFLPKAT